MAAQQKFEWRCEEEKRVRFGHYAATLEAPDRLPW